MLSSVRVTFIYVHATTTQVSHPKPNPINKCTRIVCCACKCSGTGGIATYKCIPFRSINFFFNHQHINKPHNQTPRPYIQWHGSIHKCIKDVIYVEMVIM